MRFLFGCFLAFFTTLHAQPLIITEDFEYAKASPFMDYVADTNHSLTLQNIEQAIWKPMISSNLGGFNDYSTWTKLSLKNNTPTRKRVILKNPRASMDEINVYIVREYNITNIMLGDQHSIHNRNIPHRYGVDVIELMPYEEIQIITQLSNSIGSTEGEWEVCTRKYFIDFTMSESLWWGIFIGIYLALFCYSIPILLASKDKLLTIYFTGYVISSIGYQLAINGILHVWGMYGYCVNMVTLLFGILFFFFTFLVILEFFKLTHHNGLLSRILRYTVVTMIIEFLLSFICFFEPTFIRIYALILIYTSVFILGIWFLLFLNFLKIYTDKIYLYIFLAYTSLFIAHTYQLMVSIGFFPINILSIYSVSAGSVLEMFFLAMGISLYIKQMREETKTNQQLLDFQMRFASIGRVIGNISHQWKMPMIRAGSLLTHIEALIHFKNDKTLSEIEQTIPQIRSHFIFMQNTIDEFYSLYSKNTNKSNFKILNVINDVWGMLSTKVSSCDMKLFIKDLQDTCLESFEYSFSHIVIILIDNSLDAMKARNIPNPYMNIDISHENGIIQVIFEDNCGGIEQEPIESIFDGITSSKPSGGLGLSIVKLLVSEKFNGKISACNTAVGAQFILHIPMCNK